MITISQNLGGKQPEDAPKQEAHRLIVGDVANVGDRFADQAVKSRMDLTLDRRNESDIDEAQLILLLDPANRLGAINGIWRPIFAVLSETLGKFIHIKPLDQPRRLMGINLPGRNFIILYNEEQWRTE